MDGSLGTRLRSQRERQQVALTLIAEQTKIKASLLEGLERGDVSQWPMGIFRRSFVRAYAQAIGLEPDTVLREFLELYPDPVEEDLPAVLAAARERSRPPTRLGYLISSAISALPTVRVGARTRLARDVPSADDGGGAADLANDASAGEPARTIQSDPADRYPELVAAAERQPCAGDPVDLAASDPGSPSAEALRDGIDRSAPVSGP